MSWDAEAILDGMPYGTVTLADRPLVAQAFLNAAKEAAARAGKVDGFLKYGSLDCSACKRFLEISLVVSPGKSYWTPAEVRAMHRRAKWPPLETVEPALWWAYWSARLFLDVCAEYQCGVSYE